MVFMLIAPPEFAAKLRQAKNAQDAQRIFSAALSGLSGLQGQAQSFPSTLPAYGQVQLSASTGGSRLECPFVVLTAGPGVLGQEHRDWLAQLTDWTLDILHGLRGRTRHGLTGLALDADLTGLAETIVRTTPRLGIAVLRFEGVGTHFLTLLDIVRHRFPGSRFLSAGSGADGVSVLVPNWSRESLESSVGLLREDLEARFVSLKLDSARISMGISYFPEDSQSADQLVAGARIGSRRAAELPGNRIHAMVASGGGPSDAGKGAKSTPSPAPPQAGAAQRLPNQG